MIRDRNIAWKRKKFHINVVNFSDAIGSAPTAGLAAGAPATEEISDFNLAGVAFPTDGDLKQHYMTAPYDLDADEEIGFRVLWTSGSSETADTVLWKVFCDFFAAGATLAAPTTVLDTVLDDIDVTGAYDLQWTSRGILNTGDVTQAQIDAGALMALGVEGDTVDAGLSEELFALVLEIDYGVRACN